MKNVPDTQLGRLYREHIQLILDKNIEALLDQYTDDCGITIFQVAILIESDFYEKEIFYYEKEHRFAEEGAEVHFLSAAVGPAVADLQGHDSRPLRVRRELRRTWTTRSCGATR
jgi:hypothetical protein